MAQRETAAENDTTTTSPLKLVYHHLVHERRICHSIHDLTIGHVIDSLQEEGLFFWRDARFETLRQVAWQMAGLPTIEPTTRPETECSTSLPQNCPPPLPTVQEQEAIRQVPLNSDDFVQWIAPEALLLVAAFSEELVIPDWKSFTADMAYHFEKARPFTTGQTAQYIDVLKNANPERWAAAFCTVDGQRCWFGDNDDNDATHAFSIQSVSKPVTYALCLQQEGEHEVDEWISTEPAGRPFNTQDLEVGTNRPFNASVNSGAIMAAGLFTSQFGNADEDETTTWMDCVNKIRTTWYQLCGQDGEIGFSQETFESERETAYNNIAIAYNLKGRRGLPRNVDIHKMLNVYLGCCSIEMTVQALSVAAATFANGGVCPLTRQVVFPPEVVRHVLAETMTCGMYDQAGRFAVEVGLPAKSGVSGALMVIVPNVLGYATFSPRLNDKGNSVRGLEFSKALVRSYRLHIFEPLRSGNNAAKIDPRNNGTKKLRRDLSQYALAIRIGDSWNQELSQLFVGAMVHVALSTEEGLSTRMRQAIAAEYELVYQVPLDDTMLEQVVDAIRPNPEEFRYLEGLKRGRLIHDDFRAVIAFALMELIHLNGEKSMGREKHMFMKITSFLGVDREVASMRIDRYEKHVGPLFKASDPMDGGHLRQSVTLTDDDDIPSPVQFLGVGHSLSSGAPLDMSSLRAELAGTLDTKDEATATTDEVTQLRQQVLDLQHQVETLTSRLQQHHHPTQHSSPHKPLSIFPPTNEQDET